jgi:2-keto-3-deoxy-L-rhamnonate aldolase RhmA
VRKNNILTKMAAGQKAVGCTFTFPCDELIELAGIAGYDYVFLDGEHGSFTTETIERLCRTADAAGVTPVARVPDIQLPTILRYLDRGIMGIMGPHICTSADAQQFADACRFVPQGKRSFGSGRGTDWGTPEARGESMQQINEQIIVMALLEDKEAIENLEEILSVKGIDTFSYGPNDLAQSMGLPGAPDHPDVLAAMEGATAKIRAAGKKMMSDVMVSARAAEMFVEASRAYLQSQQSK